MVASRLCHLGRGLSMHRWPSHLPIPWGFLPEGAARAGKGRGKKGKEASSLAPYSAGVLADSPSVTCL